MTAPAAASPPGRASDARSRFRRFLRRTWHPLGARIEMLEAAAYFGLRPGRRAGCTPDFLGIGGQKSGTTWLDSMLRFHPGLGLPERKEVHFFDGNFWRGQDWYLLHFRGQQNRIRGEITPAYSILPIERIRAVHALNPALRLVLIIRDPVERAWSQVEMFLVRNRRRRIEDVPDAEFFRQLESESVLSRSRFSTILDHWRSVFPAGQLHVEAFESIASEPRPLLTRVLRHIGADPDLMPWSSMPLSVRLNANRSREIPPRYKERLRQLLADEIVRLQDRVTLPQVAEWTP